MCWDYLILTACDDMQAEAYRGQLELRRRLKLLAGVRHVLVVPDPGGRRVGSGGSTICCLQEVLNWELPAGTKDATQGELWADVLRRLRILIIHAGGDSRRLPAYGPCGKVFVPLPGNGDSAIGTTLFDHQLPVYLDLPSPGAGSGQIVITSGDVLLGFDPKEVVFAPSGITGLACTSSPKQASHHGVYCASGGGRVRRFLQKPLPAQQYEAGAVDALGQSLLDIGVIHFDADSAVRLLRLCGTRPNADGTLACSGPVAEAIGRHGLDFYREFCCALGEETTLEDYQAAVRSSGSAWDDARLARVYEAVAPIASRAHVLDRCEFLHFGTTRQIITSGQELLRRGNGFATPNPCLSINNRMTKRAELVADDAWVEGCSIAGRLVLRGDNVVVGADVNDPLALPVHGCLDLLPGRSRAGEPVTFVRCYHTADSFIRTAGDDARFCGWPLGDWLASAGARPEDVWPSQVPAQQRGLWNSRLFPAVGGAGEYRPWLWMLDPGGATDQQFEAWRRAERYSLQEMAALADRKAFDRRRLELRGRDFLQSLPRYFRGGSGFSAADLAHLLAGAADPRQWITRILHEARRRSAHGEAESPEEVFAFARIAHTLGSAVLQLADRGEGFPPQSLPNLHEILGPELAAGPDTAGDEQSADAVGHWAQAARDSAFRYLRRRIVTSGSQPGEAPANALRSDEIAWGRAPARLDLTGGWTDTPPFSLEHGGCVLNAAVLLNGQPPIQVHGRVMAEPRIRLHSIDVGSDLEISRWSELMDYGSVTNEFSLVKAALVISGFSPAAAGSSSAETLERALVRFGGGLELTTLAAIPKGSGLGTSSIMGAVLLAVINRVLGRRLPPAELFHAVLRLEQALTTGGGWQDQIGGSVGGLKLITTRAGLVPEAAVRYVPSDVLDPKQNGGVTLLYYTGITRLARNILQQVVGRYLDRDREAVATLAHLRALAGRMAEAMGRKDLAEFGRLIHAAWELNKRLDPNSTSEEIETLLGRIRPHIFGAKLLGAGGGGFLLMVCKSGEDAARVRKTLQADPPNPRARFFDFEISNNGLDVSVC